MLIHGVNQAIEVLRQSAACPSLGMQGRKETPSRELVRVLAMYWRHSTAKRPSAQCERRLRCTKAQIIQGCGRLS